MSNIRLDLARHQRRVRNASRRHSPLDLKQQLVLQRRQALGRGVLLADPEEATQGAAEVRQLLELALAE
jgi:hypothetical protein